MVGAPVLLNFITLYSRSIRIGLLAFISFVNKTFLCLQDM